MMNAAMLHQRISTGRWLDGVESLDAIKNSNSPVSEIKDQWNTIRARDFRPVIEPALQAIRAVERTGRTGGLVMAVRHIAKEAEELAASYADLGADHAGPLFNRVMGNRLATVPSSPGPLPPPLPPASLWTPGRARLGPTRRRGGPTRPWTWPAAAAHSSPPC